MFEITTKFSGILLAAALMQAAFMTDLYSKGSRGGHSMGMSKHGMKSHGKMYTPLHAKLFKKAGLILSNSKELALTSTQKKEVKALKLAAEKEVIRQTAEIEIVALDIRSLLHEDKVDTAKIHSLLDTKYDIKKKLAKSMVDSIAKLKGLLNEKQLKSLKEMYKSSMHKGSGKKGMKFKWEKGRQHR